MRLGIIPEVSLREWTVGRESETSLARRWLQDETQGTLLLEGRYGSGKTHMLSLMAQDAMELGFAVSRVRIDPFQENSSFPLRFYASAMRGLRVQGRVQGRSVPLDARHAILEAARRPASFLDGHRFLGPLVGRARDETATEADWAALGGEKSECSFLPSGLDFTTVGNIACNLLSAISRSIVEDHGGNGLVVLVDEVETVEVRRYPYHWQRTLNLLHGLSLTANDAEELDEEVVQDPRQGVRVGVRTGLVYSGHYPDVKYFFQRPSRLKIALALTDCSVSGKLRNWRIEQPLVELSEIRKESLSDLYRRVAELYSSFYRISVPDGVEGFFFDSVLLDAYRLGSIRGFTKATVEALDFVRHNPGKPVECLDAYRRF